MPKLVAGVCAFVALAFAVAQQMSPVTALVRGIVVYVIALVMTSLFVSYAQTGTIFGSEPSRSRARLGSEKAGQPDEATGEDM